MLLPIFFFLPDVAHKCRTPSESCEDMLAGCTKSAGDVKESEPLVKKRKPQKLSPEASHATPRTGGIREVDLLSFLASKYDRFSVGSKNRTGGY